MKTRYKTIMMAAIFVIAQFTQPSARGQEAPQTSKDLPRENVRLVWTIDEKDKEPITFAIVNNGQACRMDNIAYTVEIGDDRPPAMMSIKAAIARKDISTYIVNYTFGMQVPISTGVSTVPGKTNDQSKVRRANYLYRDIGTESTVSMELGKPLELIRDPQRIVTLELLQIAPLEPQRVDEEPPSIAPFLGNWEAQFDAMDLVIQIEKNQRAVFLKNDVPWDATWRIDGQRVILTMEDDESILTGRLKGTSTLMIREGNSEAVPFHRVLKATGSSAEKGDAPEK